MRAENRALRAIGRRKIAAALTGAVLALASTAAGAQNVRTHTPGAFDFYVLALSWSPSFCEVGRERARERGEEPRTTMQCGERPYSFVVHGLWPQYERGFPRECQVPAPRLPRAIVDTMLDLMPAPRLVYNQWDKHGTCSGLAPQAYFDLVRRARAAVQIPEPYREVKAYLKVTPGEVGDAFIKANPGLDAASISVQCDQHRVTEVRICVDKELKFRSCGEVVKRSCRRDKLVMPPTRGS